MRIIGTGVDIIEVKRLKKAIDKYGQLFIKRVFTDREFQRSKEFTNCYQHLAGRFAAKEAVFKALDNQKLGFKDLEVLNNAKGKPYCSLLNNNSKSLKASRSGRVSPNNKSRRDKLNIYVSISHIKNYAVASAIITQGSKGA